MFPMLTQVSIPLAAVFIYTIISSSLKSLFYRKPNSSNGFRCYQNPEYYGQHLTPPEAMVVQWVKRCPIDLAIRV